MRGSEEIRCDRIAPNPLKSQVRSRYVVYETPSTDHNLVVVSYLLSFSPHVGGNIPNLVKLSDHICHIQLQFHESIREVGNYTRLDSLAHENYLACK